MYVTEKMASLLKMFILAIKILNQRL